MNNKNFNNLNYNAHDLIDNLNKLGHEFLNTTIEHSVPIINTFTNNNFQKNDLTLIKYYIKNTINDIFIMCELPGVLKEDCKVNYRNNNLIISGKTNYNNINLNIENSNIENSNIENDNTNTWSFIKNYNYYREINIGIINKENINVKYLNGCLFIKIDNVKIDIESDINIE